MTDDYRYPYPHGQVPYAIEPVGDNRCSSLVRLAALGAVVGGAVAAASNVGRLQRAEIDINRVLLDTAKTAAASAVATAVAGAAANAVAEQGLTRLGVMFAAGAAVLYGIDRWQSPHDSDEVDYV